MEFLDIFSKEKINFTNLNSSFKTKLGGLFTIIQIVFSIIIVIFLSYRKFENRISAYNGSLQFYEEYAYKFLIKYPKKFTTYFHWIDDIPLQVSTSVHLCSDEEYRHFYNSTAKEQEAEYYCRTSYNKEATYSYLVNCTDITANLDWTFLANKLGCNDELINLVIDYSDYKGEYWIGYRLYNESLLTEEVEEIKNRYDFSIDKSNFADLYSDIRTTILNTNKYIDDSKVIFWNNLTVSEIFESDYLKFSLVVLRSPNNYVKQIVSEKLNERLIIIFSSLSILNIIFSLMVNYFVEFYFQIHILETCFESEEYIVINKTLNLKSRILNTEVNDMSNSQAQEYLENIKEQVFCLSNYIKRNFTDNKSYKYIESLINEKRSLERILECKLYTDQNSEIQEKEGILKNFIRGFDLFSSSSHLRINKSKVVKSLFGTLISLLFIAISILIIYYFANNFFLNKNPKINTYIIENNNVIDKVDPHLDMLLVFSLTQEFSRMTVPVLFDFDTGKYKNITYRECTLEELSEIEEKYPLDIKLAHICINYYDIIGNVFRENPKFNNELHWVNCTELGFLGYKESECEVDLLEIGSPLYFRLDFYIVEINPYNNNFMKKKQVYYELNKIYEYNFQNKRNYNSYVTQASTRQININKNKLYLDYKQYYELSIDSFWYFEDAYEYKANLFIAYFNHESQIYSYHINYGIFQDTLSVCQILISLVSFILYTFYFLYDDYSILISLTNNLKNSLIIDQFSHLFNINNNNSNLMCSGIQNNDNSYKINEINANNDNNHISFQKLLHLGNKASIIETCKNDINNYEKQKVPNDEIEMIVIKNGVVNPSEDNEKVKQEEIKVQKIKKLIHEQTSFWEYVKYYFSSNDDFKINKVMFKVLKLASFEYLINKNFHQNKLMLTSNKSILKKLDFLTEQKNFFKLSNNAKNPICGGILSILYLLIIFPVVYYVGYDFFYKTNPIISSEQNNVHDIESKNNTKLENNDLNFLIYSENGEFFKDFLTYFYFPVVYIDIYNCDFDKIYYYFNLTEKLENSNDYACFGYKKLKEKNKLFTGQEVLGIAHRCTNKDLNCDLPTNNYTFGFSTGFTVFNLNKTYDFLENRIIFQYFNLPLLEFPYIRFDFQYNLIRNDVGIFGDNYEEYVYLNNYRSEISKSPIFFYFKNFEININISDESIIYTRKYKHLSETIRESFSILLLIAVIFKSITNFINDYYYEQYLIDLFYRKFANTKITKQTIKWAKDTLFSNADNKKSFKYKLSFWNYTFSELPLMSFLADNEYLNIKSEVLEMISLENILS